MSDFGTILSVAIVVFIFGYTYYALSGKGAPKKKKATVRGLQKNKAVYTPVGSGKHSTHFVCRIR